ncbi:MAG: ABC transporter substrate-binding protein [Treponema sp.]|jgi:putative aldouronate transport system substrate-binding protein|nr:ABC transporter substrate-binding protein [Treponema sp.]
MKKFLFTLAVFVLAAGMAFPGGRKQQPEAGGKRTVTFIIFGDKTDRMVEYMANDLPKLMQEKGLGNIEVDLQVLPWSEYVGPGIELRYANGEDFATWTGTPELPRFVSKGYLLEITDAMINAYAPNAKAKIAPESFTAFSQDGKCYALPIGNKPNASEWYAVAVRQDILEETGMREITTLEELEAFYTAAKRLHPEYIGFAEGGATDTYGAAKLLSGYISSKNMLFLNELIITDASANDDRIWSYFESDEFKNYAAIARRWNQIGIIDSQVLSDSTIAASKWTAGQAFFRNGNAGRPWEDLPTQRLANTNAKLRCFFIGETRNRPKISRGTYSTAFQISVNAAHPEDYLKVIDLLYSDRAAYDYMVYGVNGKDYTLDAKGKLATRPSNQVFLPEWAPNYVPWQRFDSVIDDAVVDDYRKWNDGAIMQKDIGFTFDAEPVKVEYAQIQAVVNEYAPQIVWGFADYNTVYPEFLRRLKNAGIDRYAAEFQKQFSTFYSGKK